MPVRRLFPLVSYLLCSFGSYSNGYLVYMDSPCFNLCKGDLIVYPPNENAIATQPWDIICDDWELAGSNSTVLGRKFKSCLECESTSSFYDSSTNVGNLYWFLCRHDSFSKPLLTSRVFHLTKFVIFIDNMKATVALCLFGYPDDNRTYAYTQCSDICSGEKVSMKMAVIYEMEKNNATVQYSYCENGAFQKNYGTCIECLNTLPSASGLSNCKSELNHLEPVTHRLLTCRCADLRALDEACIQQPPAGPNSTVKLDFDLFRKTAMPMSNSSGTNPSAETTVTVTYSRDTSSPSLTVASSQAISSPSLIRAAPLNNTASKRRSIALGVSIGLALFIAAIVAIVLLRLHTQRKRIQQETELHEILEPEHDRASIVVEMATSQYAVEADGEPLAEAAGKHLVEVDAIELRSVR